MTDPKLYAIIPPWRCESCKWWRCSGQTQWGRCDNPGSGAYFAAEDDDGHDCFNCTKDFGCILWEPKP